MEFIDPKIQSYAENQSKAAPDILSRLERYTHNHTLKPRMLSGFLQGRVLSMFSNMMQADHILEIGTYTGYSALCLAEGLTDKGVLYTLDNNDEVMAVAEKFFAESEFRDKIKAITGDAVSEITKLNEKVAHWDLIWIDADKSNYSLYFDLCIDKLRSGGLMMADNVLWSGKILDSNALQKDEDTTALHAFNQKVRNDPRVENVLLPVRDGIMMIRKK